MQSAECRVNERVKDSRIKGILQVERSCQVEHDCVVVLQENKNYNIEDINDNNNNNNNNNSNNNNDGNDHLIIMMMMKTTIFAIVSNISIITSNMHVSTYDGCRSF